MILDSVGSFLLNFWRFLVVLVFDPNRSFLEMKVKMLYSSVYFLQVNIVKDLLFHTYFA